MLRNNRNLTAKISWPSEFDSIKSLKFDGNIFQSEFDRKKQFSFGIWQKENGNLTTRKSFKSESYSKKK